MTRGERAADWVASFIGSWKFVIGQAVFLAAWFAINSIGVFFEWDAYPFILANLFMSAEAAFATPLLLMSQNRAAAQDRQTFTQDFMEDQETNRLVEAIARKMGISDDQGN